MRVPRLLLVLLLYLLALPSLADVENQIDTEELLDILQEISETAEEFARISKLGAAELRDRTDEEIFALYGKRPDIPVLAIEAVTRYLRAGRTDQALKIAETLNIVYPTIPALRAFYGTLLVKSQSLLEAREQLVIIRKIAKKPEDQKAVDDLRSLIDREARPGRLGGFMSVGVGYTDNASLEESGESSTLATGLLSLDGTYRLGPYGSPHALVGGAFAIGNRPLEEKEERLSALGASAGHQYRLENGAVIRSLVTGDVVNDGDGIVRRSPGLSLRYQHIALSGRSTTAQLKVKYNDYRDSADQGKDGWVFIGRMTSSHPIGNALLGSVSASIVREEKEADSDSEWSGLLAVALTVPVAQGFLRGAVIGRLMRADAGALGLFSAERTKDLIFNVDFSVPTKNMIDGAPDGLGQRIFYSHLRTYSNLEGGDLTENRIVFSTFYRF